MNAEPRVVFDMETGAALGPFGPCSAHTALVLAALGGREFEGWEECDALLDQVEEHQLSVGALGRATVAVLGRFRALVLLDTYDMMMREKEGSHGC